MIYHRAANHAAGIVASKIFIASLHILCFFSSATPICSYSAFAFSNYAVISKRSRTGLSNLRYFLHTANQYSPSLLKATARPSLSSTADNKNKNATDFSFLLQDKPALPTHKLLRQFEIDFISNLVQRRSTARDSGDYLLADEVLKEIDAISKGEARERISLPDGYKIEIRDISRREGGGASWSLKPLLIVDKNSDDGLTVLDLAKSALDLVSSLSERGLPINHDEVNAIVVRAKQRLLHTGEQELRGRTATDAAFWFALAGVTGRDSKSSSALGEDDFPLFDALAFIGYKELSRFGDKSSCRPMDIMHIVERIAAAGVQSEIFVKLQQEAARCLETKDPKAIIHLRQRGVVESLKKGEFSLHSERSLLWLWRFSAKQRKQRVFHQTLATQDGEDKIHADPEKDGNSHAVSPLIKENVFPGIVWAEVFQNPALPLVVDIGCGMGVCVLGLSTMDDSSMTSKNSMPDIDWKNCNFLGADLSRISINFASSVAVRWEINNKVHFALSSAEEIMEYVLNTYPGKVQLCMIQFPTPFRFNDETPESDDKDQVTRLGNMQLPTDAFSGFMVTKKLLESTVRALDKDNGFLLLQSNCEDVAVFMNRLASESGFVPSPSQTPVLDIRNVSDGAIQQRTRKWIALGGERAAGPIWNSEKVLPSARSATETEVACLLKGTPVHRVLLKPN